MTSEPPGSRRTPTEVRSLFVSRKYPPQRGGMESAAINLYSALSRIRPVTLVKFGLANKWLPVVLPLLFVRALWHGARKSTDVIVLQDGVLAPMGVILKWLTRKPIVVIIHGLEVTHTGRAIRTLMDWSLPKMSHIVAVSGNTRDIVRSRFPSIPTTVLGNGVPDDFTSTRTRAQLNADLAVLAGDTESRFDQAIVLATIGRLVPRKGVRWFVEDALPLVIAGCPRDVVYLIVGAGPEREAIEATIARADLGDHVRLLGRVEQGALNAVYSRADVFVMPNVPVDGDAEGFGIAALEASSTGTPVVAADVDGISDAVRAGNGILVPTKDAAAFANAVLATDSSPRARDAVRTFTLAEFSWEKIAESLRGLLDEVVGQVARGRAR